MKTEYFESAELSDLGRKRKNNEDHCLRIPDKGVFCVADGMGGVVGGDLASERITAELQEVLAKAAPEESASLAGRIALVRKAANQASRWIKNFSDEKVIGQMGSTLVALVLDPRNPARAVGLHAGDSRLYRYRNGVLEVLTRDHSAVAALAAKLGRAPESLPAKYQNELLRAVGLNESVELEQTPVNVLSADVFLLCSDGLSRMVTDEALAEILKERAQGDVSLVAQALVDAANEAGGKDNITVVLVRVGDISGLASVDAPEQEEDAQTMVAPALPLETDADTTQKTPTTQRLTSDTTDTFEAHTPHTPPTHDPTPKTPSTSVRRRIESLSRKAIVTATTVAAILCVGVALPLLLRKAPETPPSVRRDVVQPQSSASSTAPNRGKQLSPTLNPATPTVLTNVVAVPPPSVTNKPVAIAATTPPPPPPPIPVTGALVLQSAPTAADVFLLGRRVGVTPYEARDLPVGPMAYTLGTMTHTGAVGLTVLAGQRVTTNVVLALRLFNLQVTSDPTGAEVWIGGQTYGKTPTQVPLPAGRQELRLKYAGLNDRALSVDIKPDRIVPQNVRFAYGGLGIQSQPAGATVTLNGKVMGRTPYNNRLLPVGPLTWQLALEGHELANGTLQVTDNKLASVNATLRPGEGALVLRGNRDGIRVSVDGGPGRVLSAARPLTVMVAANTGHTVVADYHGQRQTQTDVRVKMSGKKLVEFSFDAVTVVEKPQKWTNALGMVFGKLPGVDCWMGTTRITPGQYEQIMGSTLPDSCKAEEHGQPCVINVSYGAARSFAKNLTAKLKSGDGWPAGYETGRFAVPTPEQWKKMADHADALGIELKNLTRLPELCLAENDQGVEVYFGGYVPGAKVYAARKFPLQPVSDQPCPMTIRIVLRP